MSSFCAACDGLMLSLRQFIAIELRVLPEPDRDWKWIDGELTPPPKLVTLAMKLAVVDPTNRDGELVADSVSECARLYKRIGTRQDHVLLADH
jgi:hypothetical protein